MFKFVTAGLSLYLIIILSGCGSSDIINSRWTDEPVPMSATFDDWRGKTFYVQDKSLMVGVQNDSEFLYLTLITGDRSNKMQIFGRGLSIWFDKKGGDDKYFGINYPTGLMGNGTMPIRTNDDNDNGVDFMSEIFAKAQAQNDFNLLGPGENDKKLMSLTDLHGLVIQMDVINDVLIYKMKIALHSSGDNDVSLGLKNNIINIGLGLETTEFKFNRTNDKGEQNERGNTGNRRRGPGNRGNRGSQPEQLKYWCSIKLAGNGINVK